MSKTGSQNAINEAAKNGGSRGGQPPKGRPNTGAVGNETKADMAGAQGGQPTDKNPLHGAVQELARQHPQRHDDHGPHHGDASHIRHKPMKLG